MDPTMNELLRIDRKAIVNVGTCRECPIEASCRASTMGLCNMAMLVLRADKLLQDELLGAGA